MPNAPLKHVSGSTVTTVIDPRFGTGTTPTQPSGWGGTGGGTSTDVAVLDVANQYGTGLAHIQAAITQANANALAKNGGPTTVFLDAREWTIDGVIYMKSHVTLAGAGREATILKKTGGGPVIAAGNPGSIYDATRPAPALYGATIQDLWIDCANQTTSPVGGYSSKGIYYVDVARSAVRRVRITDTQASALGWDYPSDHSIIEDCVVSNPGRMGKGDGIGGNAYGTMSGGLAEEDFIITNCTAIDARAGVVVEVWKDMAHNGHGPRVDNCISIDCIYGFENAGVPAATFDSCISLRATQAGFKFGRGDHTGNDLPTGLATMNNCFALDGLGDGVHAYFDTPAAARYDSLVLQGNVIDNNAGAGVKVTLAAYDVDNFTTRNNTITHNGGGAIRLTSSGAGKMIDLSIHGNEVHGNTGTGIKVDTDTTRGRIEGNNVTGGTTGLELVAGRTATGLVVNGGRLSSPTPVNIAGTLTDCSVGFVPGWTRGNGAPTAKAPKGTRYERMDGTAGTLLYVNTDGATAWAAYA